MFMFTFVTSSTQYTCTVTPQLYDGVKPVRQCRQLSPELVSDDKVPGKPFQALGNSCPRVFLGKNLDVVEKKMETCIYNIAEICWGKPEPRPGLFVKITCGAFSRNLYYSPIHPLYPSA